MQWKTLPADHEDISATHVHLGIAHTGLGEHSDALR